MLIKGHIIPRNYKKARKILEKNVKEKDLSLYYFLHGKIVKKEKNFVNAKENFMKSILNVFFFFFLFLFVQFILLMWDIFNFELSKQNSPFVFLIALVVAVLLVRLSQLPNYKEVAYILKIISIFLLLSSIAAFLTMIGYGV